MPKNQLDFGTVLYEQMGRYGFSRISKRITPWNETRFAITTEGLAVFSTATGWDYLDWEKIKEPDASDAVFFGGFDIKGTVKFSTPISSVVTGKAEENIKSMPTEFYYKLIEARRIVRMFEKDKDVQVSWKDIALIIWAKDLHCRAGIRKEEYINLICEWRITHELFKGDNKKIQLAIDLFRKGFWKTEIFKNHYYECRKELNDTIDNFIKKNKNNGENNGDELIEETQSGAITKTGETRDTGEGNEDESIKETRSGAITKTGETDTRKRRRRYNPETDRRLKYNFDIRRICYV